MSPSEVTVTDNSKNNVVLCRLTICPGAVAMLQISLFLLTPKPSTHCTVLLWCNPLEHFSSWLHTNKYLYKGMVGVYMKYSSGYICPFKMNCFGLIWP